MKKMVCEICASQSIRKENGVFVCQDCGTEYLLEDAKKLLVEIPAEAPAKPVEVAKPTNEVKVDSKDKEDLMNSLILWLDYIVKLQKSFSTNIFESYIKELGKIQVNEGDPMAMGFNSEIKMSHYEYRKYKAFEDTSLDIAILKDFTYEEVKNQMAARCDGFIKDINKYINDKQKSIPDFKSFLSKGDGLFNLYFSNSYDVLNEKSKENRIIEELREYGVDYKEYSDKYGAFVKSILGEEKVHEMLTVGGKHNDGGYFVNEMLETNVYKLGFGLDRVYLYAFFNIVHSKEPSIKIKMVESKLFKKKTTYYDFNDFYKYDIIPAQKALDSIVKKYKDGYKKFLENLEHQLIECVNQYKATLEVIPELEDAFNLPIQYRNIEDLVGFIKLLQDGRADSWKELVNLYEDKKFKEELLLEIKKINMNLNTVITGLIAINNNLVYSNAIQTKILQIEQANYSINFLNYLES